MLPPNRAGQRVQCPLTRGRRCFGIPVRRWGEFSSLLFLVVLLTPTVHGGEIDIPVAPFGRVTDVARILPPIEREALETKLQQIQNETTAQIAIVILPDLAGLPIEEVALELGRRWGVGVEGRDNGIVILAAIAERQVRIEVGYGLEGVLPDIVAKKIIEERIVPRFREEDYDGGIHDALGDLRAMLEGEETAVGEARGKGGGAGVGALLFWMGIILLQWLVAVFARTRSWWLGGVVGAGGGTIVGVLYGAWVLVLVLTLVGLLLDYVVSKNYHARGRTAWWAGGTWGPGGRIRGDRGGFGGFGGGRFGGGGAMGRW